jgi:trafficking protein particle complex subunit 9
MLSLLRPSHFPLAVIGIAKSTQADSLPSLYSQFNASLADIFPHGGLFPLVKNCFVYEGSEGTTNFDTGKNMPGLNIVPSIAKRKLHIGTLLGVLCSHILTELGVLVRAFICSTWTLIHILKRHKPWRALLATNISIHH